jgi:uncharacterized protein (DUF3820 family)
MNNQQEFLPIIPFGKYKGKDVTALMEDTSYLIWLKQQPWFKEKMPIIFNIVINGKFKRCTNT